MDSIAEVMPELPVKVTAGTTPAAAASPPPEYMPFFACVSLLKFNKENFLVNIFIFLGGTL